MLQDIGIAEQQKVGKRGRDDSTSSVYNPPSFVPRPSMHALCWKNQKGGSGKWAYYLVYAAI